MNESRFSIQQICDAYEKGAGVAFEGSPTANPYNPETEAELREAYNYGYVVSSGQVVKQEECNGICHGPCIGSGCEKLPSIVGKQGD